MTLMEILEVGDGAFAEIDFVKGCLYVNGLGVDKDDVKALTSFQKAASSGVVAAHYSAGMILLTTGSTTDRFSDAVKHLSKAADKDFVPALLQLALLYESGQLVARDIVKAFGYYLRAAELGTGVAATWVAQYYENPATDEEPDLAKALNWYLRAADSGDAVALEKLADVYRTGELGVQRDEVLAEQSAKRAENLVADQQSEQLSRIRSAARNGDKASQKMLSEVYRLGALGIDKSEDEYTYWLNKFLDELPS